MVEVEVDVIITIAITTATLFAKPDAKFRFVPL
jgi:hypothetical protein